MNMLRPLTESNDPSSFANKLSSLRFHEFEASAARLPRPLRILTWAGQMPVGENRGWHECDSL